MILLNTIYDLTMNTMDTNKCENNFIFKYKNYNENEIKSGDLILFLPYDHYSISRLYKNIIFQHYGIIVKINEKLYILECTNDMLYKNKKYCSNIYCTELEPRISAYSGNILISKLNKKLSIEQDNNLIQFALTCIKYHNSKDYYTYISKISTFLHFYHNFEYNDTKKFTCISFIDYIYQKILKIIDEKISPNQLCEKYHNMILFGNIFEYPYEILLEKLYINKIKNKSIIIYK